MQQDIKLMEGLTLMMWFLLVFWFDTHTQTDRQDKQGSVDWHTYEYMLTPPFMCTQELPVLYWMDNFLIQKFTSQKSTMSLLFKNYSQLEV